jgi:hypothetical protein
MRHGPFNRRHPDTSRTQPYTGGSGRKHQSTDPEPKEGRRVHERDVVDACGVNGLIWSVTGPSGSWGTLLYRVAGAHGSTIFPRPEQTEPAHKPNEALLSTDEPSRLAHWLPLLPRSSPVVQKRSLS